MQVISNRPSTHQLWLARDKHGREHYCIVVKITYALRFDGAPLEVADVQRPVVPADVYRGDAGSTSLLIAHDVALHKPLTDFVVVGDACAPGHTPVRELTARVVVEGALDKSIRVIGDRRWEDGIFGLSPNEPAPFRAMPVVFERAYGGTYRDPDDENVMTCWRENLVGVGHHDGLPARLFVGSSLPNLEDPGRHISSWGDRTGSMCFSYVSPHWASRARFAGTYDQTWLDERYPLLPLNYDARFEQSAPPDQQLNSIQDGQSVAMLNMHSTGVIRFRLPAMDLPITFLAKDEPDLHTVARPDAVAVLCNEDVVTLTWRASLPCRRKFHALRKVVIGDRSAHWFALQRSSKPYYPGLGALCKAELAR